MDASSIAWGQRFPSTLGPRPASTRRILPLQPAPLSTGLDPRPSPPRHFTTPDYPRYHGFTKGHAPARPQYVPRRTHNLARSPILLSSQPRRPLPDHVLTLVPHAVVPYAEPAKDKSDGDMSSKLLQAASSAPVLKDCRYNGKHAAHGCCKCRSANPGHARLIWYSRSSLGTSTGSLHGCVDKARLTSGAFNRMIGW